VIPELKREARSGFIGFRSFAGPEDAPPGALVGNIANVVVRPGVVPADFPAVAADAVAPAGSLLRFRLSPAYTVAAEGPILSLEGAPGATANWQTVSAERSGLLNLGRFVTRAPRSRGTALARVTLHAQQAGSKPLELGYSDDISVFLNGQLLFTGHASYSFNFPRREGLIGLGQETLYLPLRAGDNELTLAVSEVFGGWGLMARLPDPGGVEVRLP
jgi:hypothetical protein